MIILAKSGRLLLVRLHEMQMLAHPRTLITFCIALLVTAPHLSACSDACVELSKAICDCEQTAAQRRACTERVDNEAAAKETTAEQEERCEGLLDECSCEALAAGNLAACGLSHESSSLP